MLNTSALNLDSKLNALLGFCEAATVMKHKGPEWKRLKMFCESVLDSIKSGRFNEADTDDLLANFASLQDLWDNSINAMVERDCLAALDQHPELNDPAWRALHPEITEEY